MKAVLAAYYNRNPQELTVAKPDGEWMAFDAFLRSLGFRAKRCNGHTVPGEFKFLTRNNDELERVIEIVKAGGSYLTNGNLEFTFQI